MTPSSTRGPWEPTPFQITKVIHNRIMGIRQGEERTRDRSDWKLLVQRPAHLEPFIPRRDAEKDGPVTTQYTTPGTITEWDETWEDDDDTTTPSHTTRAAAARRQMDAPQPRNPNPPARAPLPPPNYNKHLCPRCHTMIKSKSSRRTCGCKAKQGQLQLQPDVLQ